MFSRLTGKVKNVGKRIGAVCATRNYFRHVRPGCKIYQALKQRHGEDAMIFSCALHGSGDIYFVARYLEEYIKRNHITNFVFLLGGRVEAKVAVLFPNLFDESNIEIISEQDIRNLMCFRIHLGCGRADICHFHHCADTAQLNITCGLEGLHGLSMADFYLYTTLALDHTVAVSKPQFNSLSNEIKEFFKTNHLIPGKTVVISPYSVSGGQLPEAFWTQIVMYLIECGYSVCTNSCGETEPVIFGTVPVFFQIADTKAFLEYAGYFIAYRSGLCDLASTAKCKKIIIYPHEVFYCPPGKVKEYVGMVNMGLCNDVEEIEFEETNSIDIVNEILSGFDGYPKYIDTTKGIEMEIYAKKISVIIPAYNAEKTIENTLNSIQYQGFAPDEVEILVVENGSVDATAAILVQCKTKWPNVDVISVKKNIGVSRARNLAIEKAVGKYVAFCDSDDEVVENSYAKMYQLAEKENAEVVVGNYYDVWADGSEVLQVVNRSRTLFSEIFFGGTVWCKIYSAKFLQENNILFPGTNHMEDNVFLGLVSISVGRVSIYGKPIYRYMRGFPETNILSKEASFESFHDSVISVKTLYDLPLKCSESERFYSILGALKFLNILFENMMDYEERKKSFHLLQDVVKLNNWNNKESFFKDIWPFLSRSIDFLQMDYNIFETLKNQSASPNLVRGPEARDKVIAEFQNGQIGFRYILRYIKAWFSYKVK